MANNFKLIYRAAWYKWLPIDLYECAIGLFFFIIGAGVIVVECARYLNFVQLKTGLPWYEELFAVLIGFGLMVVAGRATITSLIDIISPANNYEGILAEINREHIGGTHGGYDVWSLKSGENQWSIECIGAPADLPALVKVKHRIRLRYRRGTRWVTHLWTSY